MCFRILKIPVFLTPHLLQEFFPDSPSFDPSHLKVPWIYFAYIPRIHLFMYMLSP